jgi:hypothetical protein
MNWWNIPLVDSIFADNVAAQICGMAICPWQQVDTLVWASTQTGNFSIRSAYYLEMERQERNQGSRSRNLGSNSTWKCIWQLRVPCNVKLFLWRGCNEILPTKKRLFKRKVVDDPLCPLCGRKNETSGHVLWSCEASTAVWAECTRGIQKCVIERGGIPSYFWATFRSARDPRS